MVFYMKPINTVIFNLVHPKFHVKGNFQKVSITLHKLLVCFVCSSNRHRTYSNIMLTEFTVLTETQPENHSTEEHYAYSFFRSVTFY